MSVIGNKRGGIRYPLSQSEFNKGSRTSRNCVCVCINKELVYEIVRAS